MQSPQRNAAAFAAIVGSSAQAYRKPNRQDVEGVERRPQGARLHTGDPVSLQLGLDLRDEAFDRLERTRAEWIARALTEARALIARDGYVTTDSLRDVCQVPEGVDARVVGAVLNRRNFLDAGPTKTSRRTSHGRPISKWILNA